MSYFSDNYEYVKYPLSSKAKTNIGLRNAQIGAIHSLSSYFTTKNEPVLISMPTGSGKTAVIMMSPYVLRVNKILVITPTVLVRSQISNNFEKLDILKHIGVFTDKIKNPIVHEMKNKYTSEMKNRIKHADVVVSTPKRALPLSENDDIKDMFDLIVIDEAHHEPAKTWRRILKNMPTSKQILFTATPFRRDKKEIKAEHIYNYPLSKAYQDGIFGEINFIPVEPTHKENKDIIIAKKGEEVFLRDKTNGYQHLMMVRCSSKKEATYLFDIYTKNTNLKLEIIDSSKSRTTVAHIIEKLEKQEINGIICVDMMAEGFDFPNLKIAVIHGAHKSLATTLQFIGRFARTNINKKIGGASFIALKDEEFIMENKKLFSADAVWQDIIIDLSEGQINKDLQEQNYYKNYTPKNSLLNNREFSLQSIRTNFHAKIYYTTSFSGNMNFPNLGFKIENHEYNTENQTIVVIASEKKLPRWSTGEGVYYNKEYIAFIIHYQKKNNLLFINSHIKSESIYDDIATAYCGKNRFKKITMSNIHKVLSGVVNHEIFNSGLANRLSEGESYKISSGSDVSKALDPDSGKLYSPGHVFCKAEEADTQITIGYSSGSKIWSSSYGTIREMVKWFELNGDKISNKDTIVKTNTNYDFIPMPKPMKSFPQNIFMWDFNGTTYSNPYFLMTNDGYKDIETVLNIHISIDLISLEKLHLKISTKEHSYIITRDLNGKYESLSSSEQLVSLGRDIIPLSNYLNEYPLNFYTSNLGLIQGNEISEFDNIPIFDKSKIIAIDWDKFNTDIKMEFKDENYNGSMNSIHDTLYEILKESKPDYIIYDHTTGEIADYITIRILSNEINISLYHVKSQSSVNKNSAVNDVYEVLGQSIKSLIWIKNKETFRTKIRSRQKSGHGIFINGNIENLEDDLKKNIPIRGKVIACQPSLTNSEELPEKISEVLSATNMKVMNSAVANEFIVWGS